MFFPGDSFQNRAPSLLSSASVCLIMLTQWLGGLLRSTLHVSILQSYNLKLSVSLSYGYYKYFLLFSPLLFRRNIKISKGQNWAFALPYLWARFWWTLTREWALVMENTPGMFQTCSLLFLVPRTQGDFSWIQSWEPSGLLSVKLDEAELLHSLLTFYKLSIPKSFKSQSSLGNPFGTSSELWYR